VIVKEKEVEMIAEKVREVVREELQLALKPLIEQLQRGEISANEFEQRSRKVLASTRTQ
jgi:hypothetical protein